jgi:hypothetical protein
VISLVLIALLVGFFMSLVVVIAGHIIYDQRNKLELERALNATYLQKIEEQDKFILTVHTALQNLHSSAVTLKEAYDAFAKKAQQPTLLSTEQMSALAQAIISNIDKKTVN